MSNWLKKHQQKIALGSGYVLVFLLAFGLGKITTSIPNPPEIVIEEPSFNLQSNSTPEVEGTQVEAVKPAEPAAEPSSPLAPVDGECPGKIKGNIEGSTALDCYFVRLTVYLYAQGRRPHQIGEHASHIAWPIHQRLGLR